MWVFTALADLLGIYEAGSGPKNNLRLDYLRSNSLTSSVSALIHDPHQQ